jgi:hypothetical protein
MSEKGGAGKRRGVPERKRGAMWGARERGEMNGEWGVREVAEEWCRRGARDGQGQGTVAGLLSKSGRREHFKSTTLL